MIRLAAATAASLCYVEFEEVKFVSEVFLNGKQSDISIEGVLLLAVPNRFCSMIGIYMCVWKLLSILLTTGNYRSHAESRSTKNLAITTTTQFTRSSVRFLISKISISLFLNVYLLLVMFLDATLHMEPQCGVELIIYRWFTRTVQGLLLRQRW